MGSIGSEKTTLVRDLFSKMNIPYYELDIVVRIRSQNGDIKRTVAERNEYLRKII
ncbi:hypothetical protein [Oceanobacillus zhaokaii]|uniref:hypothetical protein n=1 Tax=Oceanobacillus zhaokaii TaxID=2052660 RepID=UPI001FA88438|nr:hypothetical protein [Oceanobacillus zhaokaii]